MKTSTRVILGGIVALAIFLLVQTGSWQPLAMRLGVAIQDGADWAQNDPAKAGVVSGYIVLAGVLGWLASRAGRALPFGFFFVLTAVAWSLEPIRQYFDLSTTGIAVMVVTALLFGSLVFFIRECREHDWITNNWRRDRRAHT